MKKEVKINEMKDLAEEFLSLIFPKNTATIIGLKGNLGAGKTTFTQSLAQVLNIEEKINSPTFVIEKIYEISGNENFDKLIHIDAYRLESGKELEALNWNEIFVDPKNLILLEWPEKVKDILPENLPTIIFEVVDENSRQVEFKNFSASMPTQK